MSRFQISKEEYESIKAAEKKTKDKNVSRRLHILMMRYEGYKVKEIAEITGMRINSISEMCRRYREQGLEVFVANKYGGNHRSLKEEQEREILERFKKAVEAGQMVTAQEIKRAFDEVRGKDTGRGYIYMLSQTVAVADIRRALNKGLIRKFQLKSIGTYCLYVINTEPQTEISLDNIIPRNREYITRLFGEFGCNLFSVEQCAELLGITPSSAYFNLSNFTECGVTVCHLNPGRASSYQFKIASQRDAAPTSPLSRA